MANSVFTTRNREETELLCSVYEFERSRIAGPGSSGRDINKVLWTIGDVSSYLRLEGTEIASLVEYLKEKRQIMEVNDWREGESGYITRTAETIRLMGHTYEYWHKGRLGIDAVRWLPRTKKIPERSMKPKDFKLELHIDLGNKIPNYASSNLHGAVEQCVEGFAKKHGGEKARFSRFQYRSTLKMLLARYSPENSNNIQVLTADVSSGKTLGFMLPILISAVEAKESGKKRTHLILYPRTALAKDQYDSLERYAELVDLHQHDAHSEMGTHYNNILGYDSVAKGVEGVHGGNKPSPRVIICTMETLKRRLQFPAFVKGVLSQLESVTIDEVHLINGLPGAHVATLMRRLKHLSKRRVSWGAASATIASPEEHVSRIFDEDAKSVDVIMPTDEEMVTDGINHHVFLRPSGKISTMGCLTNITSLLLHSRRDDLADRPTTDSQIKSSPKSIGFSDNLDILGRWNADLMENERTENIEINDTRNRSHPNKPLQQPYEQSWNRVQRELPYALRFQNPLQRRIENQGGKGDDGEMVLKPILQDDELDNQKVCERCKKGERFFIADLDKDEMGELQKLSHREPHVGTDKLKPFILNHPIFNEKQKVGTLDLCPFLRAGACTWFSQSDTMNTGVIEGTDTFSSPRYEYNSIIRSRVYSSKSNDDENSEDGLSALIFKDEIRNVFQIKDNKKRVSVDLVIASPSLEVGVDIPNLTESIMVKSVRNIASYRQKSGRVGRESFLDSLNCTLITDSPIDLHYYRQPKKLVYEGRLEPVPLKERNEAVVLCGIYQAVWDWLAYKSSLPQKIPMGPSVFSSYLENCLSDLRDHRDDVLDHLSNISKGRFINRSKEVSDAIDQVYFEIEVMLLPAHKTWEFAPKIVGEYTVADVIVKMLRSHPPQTKRDLVGDVKRLRDTNWKSLMNLRKDLYPLESRGRYLDSEAMLQMDRLFSAGLIYGPHLELIEDKLRENLDAIPDSVRAKKRLESFINTLEKIIEEVELLVLEGWNPLVDNIIRDLKGLHKMEKSWPKWYLTDSMKFVNCYDVFRKNPWFVTPDTLFKNPYDRSVELLNPSIPENQRFISVSEALHSFIPGSWTFRLPQGVFKVLSRTMTASDERALLRASLSSMQEKNSLFRIEEDSLPGPPGLPDGTTLTLYTPVKLALKREPRKYLPLDKNSGMIADKDEANDTGHKSKQIKIPRTFHNRWVHVNPGSGEKIGALNPEQLGVGELVIDTDEGQVTCSNAASILRHPLMNGHFVGAEWHEKLPITEFVYGSTRSYSTSFGYGVEVRFDDEYGPVAFGESLETEGVSMQLGPQILEETKSRLVAAFKLGSPQWNPSLIKAFSAYLSQLPVGQERDQTLCSFEIEDVISIMIAYRDLGESSFNAEMLIQNVFDLDSDREKLRELASLRYNTRRGKDPEISGDSEEDEDEDEDEKRFIDTIIMLYSWLSEILADKQDEFVDRFIPKWIHRCVLLSLGVTSITSMQRLTGAQSNDVGFTVDEQTWNAEGYNLYLFDRSHFGNGNCRVVRQFMHIPNIYRHGLNLRSRLLPSIDFLSTLEEGLLQCMQYHSDVSALSLHKSGGTETVLSKALGDVSSHAKEFLEVAGSTWDKIGITGIKDGWKLPLKRKIRHELSQQMGVHLDDITRATHICWNGCPECLDRIDVVLGGNYGMPYLDKAVLDLWYSLGRELGDDFHDLRMDLIAQGDIDLQIGATHEVALHLDNHRPIRSSLLPWTIGLNVDRGEPEKGVSVILRESDIVGHRVADLSEQDITIGCDSIGVKRLLWFDLVMTAYLDVVGLLDDSERRVDLVYYDIRDIDFDDVGLTPRMLDTILELAKEHGFTRFDKLSDILAWLVHRGFHLRICVDSRQSREEAVANFLEQISSKSQGAVGTLELLVNNHVETMHKKILITPIWALMGSSNMTYSGTSRSDEINCHILKTAPHFRLIKRSCDDAFHGAVNWSDII